ncbi:MAG: 50S ribosomal protein L32 [Chloroflexota bacterium]|nr:50S ribosomal protein L32 [Chloroflexota bacterium]
MGALPKKRISRGRKRRKRASDVLKTLNLVPCPHCHEMKLPHRVCPHCGYYRGVQVIEIEAE